MLDPLFCQDFMLDIFVTSIKRVSTKRGGSYARSLVLGVFYAT